MVEPIEENMLYNDTQYLEAKQKELLEDAVVIYKLDKSKKTVSWEGVTWE